MFTRLRNMRNKVLQQRTSPYDVDIWKFASAHYELDLNETEMLEEWFNKNNIEYKFVQWKLTDPKSRSGLGIVGSRITDNPIRFYTVCFTNENDFTLFKLVWE